MQRGAKWYIVPAGAESSWKEKVVKTRLHRTRKLTRTRLEERIGPVLIDAFPFAGTRCDRLTEAVIARLGLEK